MDYKEAILRVKDHMEVHHMAEGNRAPLITEALKIAIEAMEKEVPKEAIHIHEEYPEHDWIRDENGEIDMWALDYEYHNGPCCNRCGESYCVHCNPNWAKEPCIVDEYQCPVCGNEVFTGANVRCSKCGQRIKFKENE